ncbi:DUF5053 domain-containing protein [Ornithobacterium rhinotracheale]
MKDKITALKERYREATTDQELQNIREEMGRLISEKPDAWAEAMLEDLTQTRKEAQNIVLRQKLEGILPIISLSYIVEHYFGKSTSWFYQRLNGNMVNGKPAEFTPEELKTIDFALQDISKKIGSISVA